METELEQVRRNLQEHAAHVQRLDSLSELAGGVAHEYNNLLTSIIGNAEMAMRVEQEEAKRSFMEQIVESSNRATNLTAKILAYADGGLHVPDRLCLADIIRSNEPLLSATVGHITSLSLQVADEPCWVLADESQLLHVIINLVSNAAESTPGKQLDVVVRCQRKQMSLNEARTLHLGTDAGSGEYAYVEVTDNGEGMDKETVNRIFDPFFSTKFQGRGLGMATVFSIIKRHGGMIDVASAPGKGTTVAIYLPLVGPGKAETSVA
ncbi:MAG: ATP-binding protein [Gammaproteobacteria bacterium]|nr:ATP-binding protein [Gammaproteobacteria bacterium]